MASPSFSLSEREGAVLYVFNQLHNYHINFNSSFGIFEVSLKLICDFENRAVRCFSPWKG